MVNKIVTGHEHNEVSRELKYTILKNQPNIKETEMRDKNAIRHIENK